MTWRHLAFVASTVFWNQMLATETLYLYAAGVTATALLRYLKVL